VKPSKDAEAVLLVGEAEEELGQVLAVAVEVVRSIDLALEALLERWT
jgi:hypothetical protein